MSQNVKAAAGFVAIAALAAAWLAWSIRMDPIREAAANAYAECIRAEYGTEPAAWYIEHGEYPTCSRLNQ